MVKPGPGKIGTLVCGGIVTKWSSSGAHLRLAKLNLGSSGLTSFTVNFVNFLRYKTHFLIRDLVLAAPTTFQDRRPWMEGQNIMVAGGPPCKYFPFSKELFDSKRQTLSKFCNPTTIMKQKTFNLDDISTEQTPI